MLRNYFKIAWRNLLKNRFHAFINIVGLSTGILFTMIIGAYVWSELQVNKNLQHADRHYLITTKWKEAGMGYELATFGPLAKALKESHPDLVAGYYRFDGVTSNVSRKAIAFRENIAIGDSSILSMYGFGLNDGDPATAFKEPFSVVISPEKALKYFGNEKAVGQTLSIENFAGGKHDFIVTGVLAKPAANSITKLNPENNNQIYVASKDLGFFGRNMDWQNPFIVNYIELQPGVKASDLDKSIAYLTNKNAPAQLSKMVTSQLVLLSDYYLQADNGLIKKMMYALSAAALFILVMAVINFVNMSVSRSGSRMREVGIRKVMGGLRKQLRLQFLIESILIVLISTLFALTIYAVSYSNFGDVLGKDIPAINEFPGLFTAIPFSFVIMLGFLAGIYPAVVLSSMKTIESLKGKLGSVAERIMLRKSLVTFQFSMAAIVLIASIIIARQINFFFSKNLGYDKEFMIAAQVPRDWTPEGVQKMLNVRNLMASIPEVQQASLSYEIPDGGNSGGAMIRSANGEKMQPVSAQLLYTDDYYAKSYNIPMIAGQFFGSPGAVADSFKVVINEAHAKALGWKDPSQAVGEPLVFEGGDGTRFTIAGIIKDFHFESMHRNIKPMIFLQVRLTTMYRYISLRLKPGEISKSISSVQKKWNQLVPGAPFEYKFMDETLTHVYHSEIQLKKASQTATVLSLIIVLLGIMGLISMSIQKRSKEMGIRKVLGASAGSILAIFLKEFLLVIIIAGVISCPVAWYIMNNWLNEYAYRINIDASPFVYSTLSLLVITIILVAAQTFKASRENPVRSLRSE